MHTTCVGVVLAVFVFNFEALTWASTQCIHTPAQISYRPQKSWYRGNFNRVCRATREEEQYLNTSGE